MKKVLTSMALLAAFCQQAAAEMIGDTLVIEGVEKVKIETRSDMQRIVINGSKEDPQFHYVQRIALTDSSSVKRTLISVKDFTKHSVVKKKDKKGTVDVEVHSLIGLSTMTGVPDGYSFKLWSSFEIAFGATVDWYPFGKRNYWSTGLLLDWRHYRTQDEKFWAKNSITGETELTAYAPEASKTKTTLVNFGLQVPLLYTHNFDAKGKWSLTLGAIVNFNTGAHATREFRFEEEKYRIRTYDLGQRPVTVDGFLKVGTPWFSDFYVRYCPNTFFKDGRGPKMKQLSFGLFF